MEKPHLPEPEVIAANPSAHPEVTRRHANELADQQFLTDQFPWPMLVHVAGVIKYINAACVRLLGGAQASDFHETNIADFIHPQYQSAAWERVQRIMAGEADVESVELLLVRRDGSTTWIETTGVEVTYKGQAAIYVVGRDIDDRKRAELALAASEARFRSFTGMGSDWYWEQDENFRFTEVSKPEIERLPDVNPVGKLRWELPDIQMPESFWQEHRQTLAQHRSFREVEMRRIDRNGQWRVVKITGEPLFDETGRFMGYRGIGRDITARKRNEESLQIANMVYQNSSESMVVTDAENRIISVNPAFELTTGYRAREVLGRDPRMLRSGRHDKAFYEAMWRSLLSTGQWRGELWNRRRSGEPYLEQISINTCFNPDGSVHQRVALFSDITGEKRAEELIWRQANFDHLTNLPNRRMLQSRLAQALRASGFEATGQESGSEWLTANETPQQASLALLFLDLDDFKQINDSLGHATGDLLLMEVALRLGRAVSERDTVARLGGDEFAVLMHDVGDPAQLVQRAQAVLDSLMRPLTVGGQTLVCTASAGVARFPNDGVEAADLLAHADQAMYAAKKLGRNRVALFTAAMHESAQSRVRQMQDLRQAVRLGQLRLLFQPIVELRTGRIRKAEALVRWEHPQRGCISPTEFIPLAEEIGVIGEIGDWVFQEAARCVKRWRGLLDPQFQVTVNKSPLELTGVGLGASWMEHIQALDLPGDAMVVELTEGSLLNSGAAVQQWLQSHRRAGVQLAIDDFGTGYSSLSYLSRFDMDYLKIDRSFIHNLSAGSNDLVLSEVIILLAHKLGLKVVAEGVETEHQRDLLLQAGCDFGQGYFWSSPVSGDVFEALVLGRNAVSGHPLMAQ